MCSLLAGPFAGHRVAPLAPRWEAGWEREEAEAVLAGKIADERCQVSRVTQGVNSVSLVSN